MPRNRSVAFDLPGESDVPDRLDMPNEFDLLGELDRPRSLDLSGMRSQILANTKVILQSQSLPSGSSVRYKSPRSDPPMNGDLYEYRDHLKILKRALKSELVGDPEVVVFKNVRKGGVKAAVLVGRILIMRGERRVDVPEALMVLLDISCALLGGCLTDVKGI